MHASVGDRVRIHSQTTGTPERHGEVVEVRGSDGRPPYFVRFDDGHEALIYPGADSVIEPLSHKS